MEDRYTYKLIFTEGGSGITSEVIPDKAPTIEWEKESEDVKYFRRKKMGDFIFSKVYQKEDGSLHFGNGFMFEYIWKLYFDATKQSNQLDMIIYDNDRSEYVFQGYFAIKDIKLDLEAQTITIKPELDDSYRWILAYEEVEVDIIDTLVGTQSTAQYVYETEEDVYRITRKSEYEAVISGGATPQSWEWIGTGVEPNWSADQGDYPWTEDPYPEYFFHRYVSRYWIDGWTEISKSDAGGFDDPRWVDPSPNNWLPTEKTWNFPNCYKLIPEYEQRDTEANGGWTINGGSAENMRQAGVIQYIIDVLFPERTPNGGWGDKHLTLKSEFFSNEINYVTGETNYLMNILVEQKSDAKDPDATNAASIGIITFKDLMNRLMDMFNVRWFIDDDGYLRIEHIKFFQNGFSSTDGTPTVCVDLSDVLKYKDQYTDEGFFNDTQRYEWSSQERPITEYWKFMEEHHTEHRYDMNYLKYDETIATGVKKERNIMKITTDIRYIMARPEDIADEGFVFYDCDSVSGGVGNIRSLMKYLFYGQLEEDQPYFPNAAFGQEHLIPDYWYYDRPYIRALVYLHALKQNDDLEYDFESAEKQLLQKDIIFLLNVSDTFDIKKYIRSYRYERSLTGTDPNSHFNLVKDEAEIITAKLDLETGYYTVTIAYGIY